MGLVSGVHRQHQWALFQADEPAGRLRETAVGCMHGIRCSFHEFPVSGVKICEAAVNLYIASAYIIV